MQVVNYSSTTPANAGFNLTQMHLDVVEIMPKQEPVYGFG